MLGSGLSPAEYLFSQSFSPDAASKQNTWNCVGFSSPSFAGRMAVTNTRPSTTHGEQIPSPRSADHLTFSVAENVVGSFFFERVTPLQFGPRHWGQSSACKTSAAANRTSAA